MQGKLNIMKLKPDLGAFYAIRPGDGSDLFSSSWGPYWQWQNYNCSVMF